MRGERMIQGGYACCKKCDSKDAFSIRDDTGKGICVGRLKEPQPQLPLDKYCICFIIVKGSEIAHWGVTRSELQMVCAAANFLLFLEEIGKWNK